MDEVKFWQIIETSRDPDQDRQSEKLAAELRRLDRDELIAFDREYRLRLTAAYDWDLWAAAYTINGGCSDDSFDYFCDWLIAQGESVYYTALKNAESLALVAKQDEIDFEDFRYVMGEVFEDKFGEDMPFDPSLRRPAEPTGTPFDESEEALRQYYPGLYRTFWGDGAAENAPKSASETKAAEIWSDPQAQSSSESQSTGRGPAPQPYNDWNDQQDTFLSKGCGPVLGMIAVFFLLLGIFSSFSGRDNVERGPSQIELSTSSPLYFARLCETRVKWWGQDKMYADGIGDTSAQTYQKVRSVKPVNIRKDIDGRTRWDVVIKTSTDSFNCSDFADNYGGEIGRKNNPVLEKIRE